MATGVKLTNLLGEAVYVWPAWVQLVRKSLAHEAPKDSTRVVLSGEIIHVQETPEQVVEKLGA